MLLGVDNKNGQHLVRTFLQRKFNAYKLAKVTDPAWFNWYKDNFNKTWQHTDKEAEVTAVYTLRWSHKVALLNMVARPFGAVTPYTMKDHEASGNDVYYHGTRRACRIGEKSDEPCDKVECHLCSILRKSFRLEHANPQAMFGPGIYSTPDSSKADTYARNHHIRSHQHAILVCTVIKGDQQVLYTAEPMRTCPDVGFDSVAGALRKDGGSINYRETVVYREDAIIPRAVIMYTRKGWGAA